MGSIIVFVLGDISQSPRMQNHISELLKKRYTIEVLAYGCIDDFDTQIQDMLKDEASSFYFHEIISTPFFLPYCSILGLLIKMLIMVYHVLVSLAYLEHHPNFILFQVYKCRLLSRFLHFFQRLLFLLCFHGLSIAN